MNRVVAYSVGLGLAIVLTLAAFALTFVYTQSPFGSQPPGLLIAEILILAMVQLSVQLIFFLHLGRDKESRWHGALFAFTFFGILVIVLASVWIMYHLNYNMTPSQINQYITNQSSF